MKLWVARDKDELLWLFDKKPVLRNTDVKGFEHFWFDMAEDGVYNYCLGYDIFPEVTFENSARS